MVWVCSGVRNPPGVRTQEPFLVLPSGWIGFHVFHEDVCDVVRPNSVLSCQGLSGWFASCSDRML